MSAILRESRWAIRSLLRSPRHSSVIVVTLAVGIAATCAIFSLVYGILLASLPFEQADELVHLAGTKRQQGQLESWAISYLDFEDWRRESEDLAVMAAYSSSIAFNLELESEVEHVAGELVSDGYFTALGQRPEHGRLFQASENDLPAAAPVVLLSHQFWNRKLGGEPDVVGTTLLLNGRSFEIVGVLPEGFRGMSDEAALWVPLAMAGELLGGDYYLTSRRFRWLEGMGRLAPGKTLDQASAELNALTTALEQEFPNENQGIGVELKSLEELWLGPIRPALYTLLGGALFLLFISFANAGSLMMARGISRQREVALRAALGAGRGEQMGILVLEGLALSLAAGLVAIPLASWAVRLLLALSPLDLRSYMQVGVDWQVFGAVLVIAMLGGALIGVVLASLSARLNLTSALKEGGRGSEGRLYGRLQQGLVVAEVALCLSLLVGAGGMAERFRDLRSTDLGLRSEGLATLRVDLKGERYESNEAIQQLVLGLGQRLEEESALESVALSGPGLVIEDPTYGATISIEEQSLAGAEGAVVGYRHHVSPGYFSTLEIELLEGRAFEWTDRSESEPKVVVSDSLAKQFWPGESVLGKRMKFGRADSEFPWMTVIGRVEDVRHQGFSQAERPYSDFYVSIYEYPPRGPAIINLLAAPRSGTADLASVGTMLTQALRTAAPDLPSYDLASVEQRLQRQTRQQRFDMVLMTLFAVLATLLAVSGIYSVVSYNVAQRHAEFGVRMALGAEKRDILRLVVVRTLKLGVVGALLGVGGAILLLRIVRHFLTGVPSLPLVVLGLATLATVFFSALASYPPARRAAKLDPLRALKPE